MNNEFPLTGADLAKKLDDSQEFMDKVTIGFADRNERIFYRKPPVNTNGQMEYAELVDNTLASYLEKMPKNVIQKMPTFMTDGHGRSKAEDLVYEFIAVKILLRAGSSKGYGLLQKQWIELRNAATFGACAVYLPFENDHGEYTVGEVPIYWGDLYPEAWSTNLNSANFTQFRSLKTEGDLEKIRDGLGDELGTWIPGAIDKVLSYGTGQNSGGDVKTNIKAAMEGLPEHMYETFKYVDDNWVVDWHYASETILRVIPNLSHRRRVVGLYSDYDGSSIMGRSLIDMAYGAQQSLTSLLRNFIYTADYNTDPAKVVKGISLNEDNFNLTKGNTMFLNDEEGKMDLLPIETTVLQNFPQLYNLLKTVLLTSLPASSDSSISSGSGDPTYSKTQAGVNDQAQKSDIENNYYRKNYEQYFEMVLENKINIYLAEVKAIADKNNAVPMITLDEEYANLVREALTEDQQGYINEKNQVKLDLGDSHGVNISVNFESTRDMAKEEDLKRLNTFMTGFFEAAKSDPSMAKVMRSVMPLLMQEMTKNSNLENSAKISKTMEDALKQVEAEEKQAQAQAVQESQQKNQKMDEVKAPTVNISFKDLPPAGKIQAAAKYGIDLTATDVVQPLDPMKPGATPGATQ
ncbi:hypothetical protein BH23PAT2_BH23PAT2_08470 [soil metagenome]